MLEAHLTYLSPARLANIEWALEAVVRDGVAGSFLEAGVAQGGSAIVIAGHLGRNRRFDGYDVFEMIPSPGESDPATAHQRYADISAGRAQGIAGKEYYGYRTDLLSEVTQAFRDHGIQVDGTRIRLHRGLVESTLHPIEPVAFAHIDCDWFEPVYLSLERIYPKLSLGGIIIVDDYYDWGGAKQAVDAFLEQVEDLVAIRGRPGNHLILRRALRK